MRIVGIIVVLLFLTGCSVCSSPYIEFKKGACCLDKNTNSICDNDEAAEISKEQQKEEQLKGLDTIKTKIENGSSPSMKEVAAALTNKTCKIYSCTPIFNPNGERKERCETQDSAYACITVEDCYYYMESLGASDSDIEDVKKENSMTCN